MNKTLALKKFRVFEPETSWFADISAKSKEQAIDKAWAQFWAKLPFTHCKKECFVAREL